jgi:hypothetical protein
LHRMVVETENFFVCSTQLRKFNQWVLNEKKKK